jgi:hypothetical protein
MRDSIINQIIESCEALLLPQRVLFVSFGSKFFCFGRAAVEMWNFFVLLDRLLVAAPA